MAKLELNKPKLVNNVETIINLNGQQINLGKLIKVTTSYCKSSRKKVQNFTCINTGKTFTSLESASKSAVNYLVNSGKVILNN